MCWGFITSEQGAKIDSICDKYRTEPSYLDDTCPDCPIRDACKFMVLPGGLGVEAELKRGRIFEKALAEAAEKVIL